MFSEYILYICTLLCEFYGGPKRLECCNLHYNNTLRKKRCKFTTQERGFQVIFKSMLIEHKVVVGLEEVVVHVQKSNFK